MSEPEDLDMLKVRMSRRVLDDLALRTGDGARLVIRGRPADTEGFVDLVLMIDATDQLPTLDWYQRAAMRTARDLPDDPGTLAGLLLSALGLTGEAGEFADRVKKIVFHDHPLTDEVAKLDAEAGDVLWYLARYAEWRGKSLTDLARENVAKLLARYPDGPMTPEASINRAG